MHFQIFDVGFVDRESKMQEEDSLRTVDCLRGRLLAERAASRAVNERAESMSNKLKELEEQLKIEIRCRRKAERKLSILKEKVQSLNITFCTINSKDSDQCSSWDHSETSCISSTGSVTENANTEQAKKIQRSENKHDLKPSEMKAETEKGENVDIEANGNADDSMALVPVNLPMDSKRSSHGEMKIDNDTVSEVLYTLKQIRQNIQGTMERRRSFKVG